MLPLSSSPVGDSDHYARRGGLTLTTASITHPRIGGTALRLDTVMKLPSGVLRLAGRPADRARGRTATAAPVSGSDSPVFLLGAARSGTSLLYKALCLHPEAAWISNWVRRYPRVPQVAVLNRLANVMERRQRAVWFGGEGSNAYVYLRRRSVTERIFPMPVEGETVFDRCGIGDEEGAQPAAGAGPALRAAFESVRRFGGGRRLVCKRIANNRRIPFLLSTFPEARFVDLVRDGRAVAYSLSRVDWWEDSRLSWYAGTPRRWAAEGGDPWEPCARNWVEELGEIDRGLATVPPHQVLHVSYEQFVASPLETLERVAAFAGLPPDERWTRRLGQLRFPDRNEAWRAALDPEVVATIEAIQGDELARHGYV